VASSCEHGNKLSGSIKGSEFLDQISDLVFQEGVCSAKLVHYLTQQMGNRRLRLSLLKKESAEEYVYEFHCVKLCEADTVIQYLQW